MSDGAARARGAMIPRGSAWLMAGGLRSWGRAWVAVWLFHGLVLAAGMARAAGIGGETNHVLHLGGGGAHAVLPVAPFRGLTNATIECWARWREFGSTRRVFNYGRPRHDLSLLSREGNDLAMVIGDPRLGLRWVIVNDVLKGDRWTHLAAVSGAQGMRLYVNGVPLLPVHPYTGSFAAAAGDGDCFLGKSVTPEDREGTFRGELDEFRVWNYARTAEEIRADLHRRVSAGEPGLVFSATFEPGDGPVELRDGARVEIGALPGPGDVLETPDTVRSGGPTAQTGQWGAGTMWRSRQAGISFVAGLLTAFCLMHSLLFAFQPTARTHFYFAAISGLGALMAWPLLALRDVTQHWLPLLAILVLRLFQLLFAPRQRPPARQLVLTALSSMAVLLVYDLFSIREGMIEALARLAALVVVVICGAKLLRIATQAWKARAPGSRSIGIGLGALVLLSGWSWEVPLLGGMTFSQLGVAFFFGATSVHLARSFALASRELERQARELAESNQRLRQANDQIEQQRRELVIAKEVADAANAAKSRFLAGVSHELRTPLNAIIGYSEMMAEEAPEIGAAALVPDLEKVQKAARHQLTLINDILDLSKIEAGKMTVYVEDFEVGRLAAEVEAAVGPLVAKRSNALTVDCPADVGTMHGDQTKVRQVLFNLLSNAAKFTDQGKIVLKVRRRPGSAGSAPEVPTAPGLPPRLAPAVEGTPIQEQKHEQKQEQAPALRSESEPEPVGAGWTNGRSGAGDWMVFEVTDTGVGMTSEQQSRLFQAFAQADPSTQARYGGTGLGLALCHRFCELMGGTIAVASEPGRGATFTVTLPAEIRETSMAVAEPIGKGPTVLPGLTAGASVLVIDDDPAVRDLLVRSLGREGVRVGTAADGAEGLEMARQMKPRIITLDVLMPGLDGWAVLTALKADPATADIPVVMMTIVDDRNLGFSLGAADYLVKPVDFVRLHALVRRFVPPEAPRRILVVEDDEGSREVLIRQLTGEGWIAAAAANGREGLERFSEAPVGLILLDLMMPEMDGFEFLAELRRRPEGARVPVVVLTAKSLTEEDRRRLNGEVARILEKGSVDREQLLAGVRELLNRSA